MSSTEPAKKMKRKVYEKELSKLQEQLCYLQDWIRKSGERVIVVLEERDAAGGTIKAITERVSPRIFRVVARPVPSDKNLDHPKVKPPERTEKKKYDDLVPIVGRRLAEQRY
jgi:polyphosphate kinase 2 (PPK2 family)